MRITFAVEAASRLPTITGQQYVTLVKQALDHFHSVCNVDKWMVGANWMLLFGTRNDSRYRGATWVRGTWLANIMISSHPSAYYDWAAGANRLKVGVGLLIHEIVHAALFGWANHLRQDGGYPLNKPITALLVKKFGPPKVKAMARREPKVQLVHTHDERRFRGQRIITAIDEPLPFMTLRV